MTVRPLTARVDRYNNSPDDIPLDLVFFSAFEDLHLQFTGTMESNRIRKLYEPSPVPTLYVGLVEDLLGRVPLFPCFLDGNTTSTIPFKYFARQGRDFAFGCAASDRYVQIVFSFLLGCLYCLALTHWPSPSVVHSMLAGWCLDGWLVALSVARLVGC